MREKLKLETANLIIKRIADLKHKEIPHIS